MRVLHASPYFAPAFVYGGPPRSVLGLCRALQAAGADVSVVTTTANGDSELPEDATGTASYNGVPVSYVRRSFPKRAFRAPGLPALLSARFARGVDLVHIHGCWNAFGWSVARECRRAGIPYVLSPRGMLDPWSFARGRARKWVSYRAFEQPSILSARFVHATSADEATVIEGLGLGRPVVTIPNGIEDESAAVRGRAGEFRSRFAIQADAFTVLFLGRLHPKKGIELLIDAFRPVAQAFSRAQLVIAGSGDPSYVAKLRAAAADLMADRRISFTGHLVGDDRALALAGADAFALTSYSENFGLGVGEAMAAGLPVVVTRACPWPMIEEWRAGWWVQPTVDAIAAALTDLMSHPEASRATGERGRAAVLKAFDWSRIGHDMLNAYASAVAH